MNSLIYYLLVSSVVLIYGIGLDRIVLVYRTTRALLFNVLQISILVFTSIFFTKIFTTFVLIPNSLIELCPFIVLIVLLTIYIVLNILFFKDFNELNSFFSISFLFALISVSESQSIIEALIIGASCILSLFFVQLLLISFKKRFQFSRPPKMINKLSLIYINIAVIMAALCVWNISWLNPGIIK